MLSKHLIIIINKYIRNDKKYHDELNYKTFDIHDTANLYFVYENYVIIQFDRKYKYQYMGKIEYFKEIGRWDMNITIPH